MTFNCKHVAATLLEATGGKPLSAPKAMAAEQSAAALPPVLGYEVVNWLENVGNAVHGDDYPAELNQRLLYRLHASGEGVQTPVLAVSLLSVRVLKAARSAAITRNPTRPISRPSAHRNIIATPTSRL